MRWGHVWHECRSSSSARRFGEGKPVNPPYASHASAPQTLPVHSHVSGEWPLSHEYRKPATKQSPAPVVSIGSTNGAVANRISLSQSRAEPALPSLSATQ